ncbi:hypothetical protein GCM10022254_49620 [Actinomadura meridiana]|uniref:Uncharacterized protein n=1 Tax=Actinomadura meridiana TaxID=559626 RepID=A0ABP8CC67_9ACTN
MIRLLVIFLVLRGFAVAEWVASGPQQPGLLALATAGVAGLLILAAVRACATSRREQPTAPVRTTLRDRTLRTAFLPQRDPDAAGRPRPRAPGPEIAAA